MPDGILVAVTDHAAERYRQRVGTRTGSVDVKPEIVTRVSRAYAAGRTRVERGSLLLQPLGVAPQEVLILVLARLAWLPHSSPPRSDVPS